MSIGCIFLFKTWTSPFLKHKQHKHPVEFYSLFSILIVRALVRLVTLANQILLIPRCTFHIFIVLITVAILQTKHRLIAFKFEARTISQRPLPIWFFLKWPLPIWLMQCGKWNSNSLVSSNRQWCFVYLTYAIFFKSAEVSDWWYFENMAAQTNETSKWPKLTVWHVNEICKCNFILQKSIFKPKQACEGLKM